MGNFHDTVQEDYDKITRNTKSYISKNKCSSEFSFSFIILSKPSVHEIDDSEEARWDFRLGPDVSWALVSA